VTCITYILIINYSYVLFTSNLDIMVIQLFYFFAYPLTVNVLIYVMRWWLLEAVVAPRTGKIIKNGLSGFGRENVTTKMVY